MLTILYGDDQVASRNALNQNLDKSRQDEKKELIQLDGEKLQLQELKQALESRSLFGLDKLVLIENLFLRTRSLMKDKILEYLAKEKFEAEIFIWEKKMLTATQLKKFQGAKVLSFKLSPKIFKFLDSVYPGNRRQSLILLAELKRNESEDLIFYMLHRRISDLIVASDSGLEDMQGMQNWQKSRLLSQAKKFSLESLLKLHKLLYQTDFKVKTGKNILPLASLLDLIVSDI